MKNRVVVALDDKAIGSVDRIAQSLRQAGMTVEQILVATGVVVGTVHPDRIKALRGVPGVVSVEPDFDMLSDPPEAGSE